MDGVVGRADAHGAYRLGSCGGMCPTQAEGLLWDDRPFYFRARHGHWDLSVGEPGWPTDYSFWPRSGLLSNMVVGEGDDPTYGYMSEPKVRAVLDSVFGELHRAWQIEWVGVPDPFAWVAAGFSSWEAQTLMLLPDGHPDRPDPNRLLVMAALRAA